MYIVHYELHCNILAPTSSIVIFSSLGTPAHMYDDDYDDDDDDDDPRVPVYPTQFLPDAPYRRCQLIILSLKKAQSKLQLTKGEFISIKSNYNLAA